ncbi:MAG TPA: malectin domain-containing carbohydrate-binding protein, partial [Pseudomonadales bacterium]|nr:malectin domain-containing carbohydrate-binding protein [Pseudomonadales bacterium]
IYFSASGQRLFNVLINGNKVLTNFDIYATAGAANKAVVRQFTLPANASGQLVIVGTNVVQNAQFNGIEVLSAYASLPWVATNLTTQDSGPNLKISWPTNYVGWVLQTNSIDLGNSADWGDVPGSQTNSQITFPMTNPALDREFFRLRFP